MPLLPGEGEEAQDFFAAEEDDVVGIDDDDDIAPAPPRKDAQAAIDADDDDEVDEDEEEYEVEKILGHGWLDDGTMQLQVKWKGWPKSDATWEPEENLHTDAPEAVATYFKRLGGRPEPGQTEAKRKRKAEAVGNTSLAGRKKTKSEDPEDRASSTKRTKDWQPPKGSWENDLNSIDAIEESEVPGGEKKIMAFVIWNNGVRSKHPLLQLHDKCPRKMLQYYYDHLLFTRPPDTTDEAS